MEIGPKSVFKYGLTYIPGVLLNSFFQEILIFTNFCHVLNDPDFKIDLKTFHCEILNDHAALKKE